MGGMAVGGLLGLLGLILTRWESQPTGLFYTPSRWLALLLIIAITARLIYGWWHAAHAGSVALQVHRERKPALHRPDAGRLETKRQDARHAGHPGGKAAVRGAVTCQRTVYPKEHVLRQILGFGAVSREPIADVEYATRVAAHKFLPGRAFALETLLDQLGILLQAPSAPSSRHLAGETPQVVSACQ